MKFDDRPDAAKRLQEAREARGFGTPKEAATFFGWKYETYIQHEQGTRGLTRAAGKYAKALRVSEGWLLTGEGVGPKGHEARESLGPPVAITGRPAYAGIVRAGAFLLVDDFNQDVEPVPEFVTYYPGITKVRQYAWKASGDSMDKAGILDGMWIVGADAADYIDRYGEIESGELVVVERTRNQGSEREVTVKEVRFYRDRYELLPRSSNPEHQPIVVPHDHADEDTEVKIIGLVLATVTDLRRRR